MPRSPWRGAVLGPLAAISLAAGAAWSPVSAQRADEGRRRASENIDPRARQVVERMGDYLGRQQAFSVTADSITEVVLRNGLRLQHTATSDVSVRRPDGLRSERRGPSGSEALLVYDGDELTLFLSEPNVYAKADAPDSLDDAIEFARERLDIEAPGGDLLFSEAGESLMEGVTSGMYVGEAQIAGTPCHHVAFRERDVDWQLWVQDGEEPLPLRYVIVSKRVRGEPEFMVQLSDWDVTTPVEPEQFAFAPPEGAREIRFAGLAERGRRAERGGQE